MEVTVLGVQKWSLTNDDNTTKDGITIHYFDIADTNKSPDKIGIFPASITADKNLFDKFTTLPGKYDFSLRLTRGTGGKAKPILVDATSINK